MTEDDRGAGQPLPLALRNTLTRRIEPVIAGPDGRVRMYSCGPTVYRWAHVGNLRSYLLTDLIRRALLYHGVEVLHVKNITDVGHLRDERFDRGDDPMLVAAGLESKTPAEIADTYEAGFHADEALVNILPAHVFPRATEHIADMLDVAVRLVAAGHAYVSPAGNVYYSVASYEGYGQLSGNSLDELRAGHRGEVEPDKRDSADFALWKVAGEGRLLKWPSPWGEGFPGWHLECSAMAMRYLGPQFEIHTGGIDNVFPHHEDEIAQSAPLVGGPPARHWVHGEHLLAEGRKMAKSAGNFERVTEVAGRGIDPLALRYLALTSRYGRKLNYSERSLRAAASALASLRSRLAGLGAPPPDGAWAPPPPLVAGSAGPRPSGIAQGVGGHQADASLADSAGSFRIVDRAGRPEAPLSPAGRELHARFIAAIDDDLDMPTALAVVRETLRSRLPADERRWLVLDADLVLGLDLHETWSRARRRATRVIGRRARSADRRRGCAPRGSTGGAQRRGLGRADELREELASGGLELTDGPDGTTWRRAKRG